MPFMTEEVSAVKYDTLEEPSRPTLDPSNGAVESVESLWWRCAPEFEYGEAVDLL
jgi:hypothetical protein